MSRFMSREKRGAPKSDLEKSVKYQKSETGASHMSTRRSVNHVRANRGEDVKKARKQVWNLNFKLSYPMNPLINCPSYIC